MSPNVEEHIEAIKKAVTHYEENECRATRRKLGATLMKAAAVALTDKKANQGQITFISSLMNEFAEELEETRRIKEESKRLKSIQAS